MWYGMFFLYKRKFIKRSDRYEPNEKAPNFFLFQIYTGFRKWLTNIYKIFFVSVIPLRSSGNTVFENDTLNSFTSLVTIDDVSIVTKIVNEFNILLI